MKTFYSNGKLLLTGEYLVLDGALSLAIPTSFGQSLKVELIDEPKIVWKSLDEKEHVWFEDEFLFDEFTSGFLNPRNDISNRLIQILQNTRQLNSEFLFDKNGFIITTKLDFPKNWGLGTSSTLINNIASWTNVDAYKLLELTFGGSGYDIACAQHNSAVTYQLKENNRIINEVDFNPSFKDNLHFVYLNKKQDSREGIAQYKANRKNINSEISEINNITLKMIDCQKIEEFQMLINQHETIISKIIKQKPIKESLFSDFNGSVKSLGAWGGDFVLVASNESPVDYFKTKRFDTIIPFNNMTL